MSATSGWVHQAMNAIRATARMDSTQLTIGSLFTGAGMLDRAAEEVFDARTAWVSDIDKGACKVLAHRYPDAPNLGDITAIDWATVPRVDIITGGYPCQPFSQAGRRLGQDDDRHLWPYVRDAIAVLRPPMAMFENVRGHLTLGFDEVVRDLHQLGYDVEWALIKASDLGACHQRARLFILGVNRERRVRSGFDRWGRLHRHSADRRVVSSAPQGQHDGQGTACPACSQEAVRRQGGTGQRADGDHAGVAHMAADGRVCDCRHQETAAPVLGEGGGCGHRAGVRCDADRLTEASEPWPLLDGRDARPGSDAEASDSGSEPARTGPRAAHAAGCEAASGLPLGLVVGAGGRPVRAGGVPGWHADERQHDRGAPVRSPGAGSDGVSDEGPSPDSDLAGLQGLANTEGASSPQRHRHPAAGAGRPDLTLLPTPAAANPNDGESVETWEARRQRTKERVGNGNGFGTPLSIAVRLLPTPRSSDTNGAGAHGTGGMDLRTAARLLPTPRATDGSKGGPNQRGSKGDLMLPSAVHQLLPTPKATNNENRQNLDQYGMNLGQALGITPKESHDGTDEAARQDLRDVREDVQPEPLRQATGGPGPLPDPAQLLPIVREHQGGRDEGRPALASTEAHGADVLGVLHDGRSARSPRRPEPGEQRPGEPADALRIVPPETALAGGPREAAGVEPLGCGCEKWGHYAPAIHRHELALGRVAPSPVEVGPSGKPRLSAFAVEWMMMLPAGWITDTPGVTRNEALKMLGNGVVTPQAVAALRVMVNRIDGRSAA